VSEKKRVAAQKPHRVWWERLERGGVVVPEKDHPEQLVFRGWAACWAFHEMQAHAIVRRKLSAIYEGAFAVNLDACEDTDMYALLRRRTDTRPSAQPMNASTKRSATLQPSLFDSNAPSRHS
jgi:hypothetical protein